ncbi:MAG TPA: right-handed parallel beta-helix repeat-containing protein, partial [Puia sp.]|nr:right-handed parallel beta-helix repeat-containing protein [Puia sp.]
GTVSREFQRVAEMRQGSPMRQSEVWGWRAIAAAFLGLALLTAYWSIAYRRPVAGTAGAMSPGLYSPDGGRRYFVDATGNDGADGSFSRPWRTVEAVNRVKLKAGDSVFFRGEQVFAGTLKIDGVTGNLVHPVWVGSYGAGVATVDGGDSAAVLLYDDRWLVVSGLRLAGAGRKSGNVRNGLEVDDCEHIRIEKIDVSGFQKAGVFVYASAAVVLDGVYAHENGAAGISAEGPSDRKTGTRDIKIVGCRADDNPGDPTNLTNHSGNGIVCGHCTRLLIDHCSATNNGWDMPRIGNGPVGIWCYEADSATIQHCLAYGNKTSVGGADGGGFDLDGGVTNSVIQYCLSYGNQGSGYCIFQYWGASPWHDNVVRWNISEDDGLVSDSKAGMYVWNSSNDSNQFYNCKVYNNTVYDSREAALCFSATSARKGFIFYNNIFVGADSLLRGNPGADVFRNNDWWVLRGKSGKSGRPGDAHVSGLFVNPEFKNPGGTMVTDVRGLTGYEKYNVLGPAALRGIGASF